ncbi:MAG: type II toxin-antitoxin system VapC family toxin [Verrucomicrobiota bacterium]
MLCSGRRRETRVWAPRPPELLRTLKTGEAVISDITLLEIAMLEKKGRIRLSVSAGEYLRGIQRNYPPMPIASDIAALAMDLELPHGDPFDWIIVASARHHELPLLTRERYISASGLVRVVW